MKHGLLMFVLLLVLSACANDVYDNPPIVKSTTGAQTSRSKVKLVLFSAPWCSECKPKLEATEALLDSALGSDRDRVQATILVTEGKRVHSKPTDAITADYGKALNTKMTVASDAWYWQTYKNFYADNQYAVPAAALLDEKGEVIQVFDRGIFLPEEVVALIQEKLK